MQALLWLLSFWWLPIAAIDTEKFRTIVNNCVEDAKFLIEKNSAHMNANKATLEAVLASLDRNFPKTCNWVARSAVDAKDRFKRKFFSDGFILQDADGNIVNKKESDMTNEEKAAVKDIRNVAIKPVLSCVRSAMQLTGNPEDAEQFLENFGDGSDQAKNEVLFEVVRNIRCGKTIDLNAKNPYDALKGSLSSTWLEIIEKMAIKLAPFVICFTNYKKRGLSIRDAFGCNGHWEWWNHGRDCIRAAQVSNDGKVPEEFKKIKIPDRAHTLSGYSVSGMTGKIWSLFYERLLCGKKGSSKQNPAAADNAATARDSKQQATTGGQANPRRKRDGDDCGGWLLGCFLGLLGMTGGLIGGGVVGGITGRALGAPGACGGAVVCGLVGFFSGFFGGAFLTSLTCG